VPDIASRAAHTMLEGAKWRQVSWRRGTKGRLSARFAAMRVRIADGPPQRILFEEEEQARQASSPELWKAPGVTVQSVNVSRVAATA